jgi:hypothetical protein
MWGWARPFSVGEIVTEARITCPECGNSRVETMPFDACRHFYHCEAFQTLLTPRTGDCCVFCSYSDSVCPPRWQEAKL